MTDKIRKYVLPNIPYLFALWVCLKLGTAYRLAGDAGLIGMVKTINPAFGTFAPGLDGFDWLIGIIGAAALRAVIYFKVKNAKKFRKDVEYGSARWSV